MEQGTAKSAIVDPRHLQLREWGTRVCQVVGGAGKRVGKRQFTNLAWQRFGTASGLTVDAITTAWTLAPIEGIRPMLFLGGELQTSIRTGKLLAKSTLLSILAALEAFFFWLAGQKGYKGRLQYSDARYFNVSDPDGRIARARAVMSEIEAVLSKHRRAFGS